MKISICTTNYNCAHALVRHLESVFQTLSGLDFEYVVVDNRSKDRSLKILRDWESRHENMKVLVRRSTMGEGRQVAFQHSMGDHIMVLDTDVVYDDVFRKFVNAYFAKCSGLSVQAVYCGIFPREQWERAGGRRSLNTNEDVDLWMRLLPLGTMRWYPIVLGENLKERTAWGGSDHLSARYSRLERVARLVRREWDLLKTREIQRLDLPALIEKNTVNLELIPEPGGWPTNRTRESRARRIVTFMREVKQTLRST